MRKVEIKEEINNKSETFSYLSLIIIIDFLKESDIKSCKYFLCIAISTILVFIIILDIYYNRKIVYSKEFRKYIKDCKNSIIYERNKIYNKNPYISICISVMNMEKYIYQNFFSILNQSFQDFEIIVINDNSNYNSEGFIKNIQLEDDRIKLISHSKNLGFYFSRIESIFNSNSKYIILMAPDSMFMNVNLFQELYNINFKYNLDIIEFSVFHQIEYGKNIYFSHNDFENHFHKFDKDIIIQPELSSILYYKPRTKEYTNIICRSIFNKLIRRDILIKADIYLKKGYYNKYIIINDDPIINVFSYQIAKNFTNINLPGYLLITKRKSKEIYDENYNLKKIKLMNFILYINLLYNYIKEFNKDTNFLFFEMKYLNHLILKIKDNNLTQIITNLIVLIEQILKYNILSNEFRIYLNNLLIYYKN